MDTYLYRVFLYILNTPVYLDWCIQYIFKIKFKIQYIIEKTQKNHDDKMLYLMKLNRL